MSEIKVCVIARIDHSKYLVEGLSRTNNLVRYVSFGAQTKALKKVINILPAGFADMVSSKSINISDRELNSSTSIYLLDYISTILRKKYKSDIRVYVHKRFEKYALRSIPKCTEILHYWSLYFDNPMAKFKVRNPNIKYLSDVYEAYPLFVSKILKREYHKLGHKHYYPKFNTELVNRYKNQDPIVVPSLYVKNSFLEYFPKKKIYVNPYGITLANKKAKDLLFRKSNNLKIIYCGSVSIEKGSHLIIQLAKAFPQHKFTLVGYVNDQIKQIYLEANKPNNIIFLGKIPHSHIANILCEQDLYLLPSLSDAYSLSVAEAMGVGLPVLLSENTGNIEVVEQHDLGLIAKTGDIDDMTNKLASVSRKWIIEKRQKLDKVLPQLSWNNYVSRMIDIYKML